MDNNKKNSIEENETRPEPSDKPRTDAKKDGESLHECVQVEEKDVYTTNMTRGALQVGNGMRIEMLTHVCCCNSMDKHSTRPLAQRDSKIQEENW